MDKVIGHIYQTTDYSKFKKLKGNRDPKTAKKIVNSINEVGYILDPILINEKSEIIDGQNRFEAVVSLGLPVLYIKQEGIGKNECQHLNINQSNWTTEQFIASYAEDDIKDYERLQSLVNDFKQKGFGLEGVVFMATPSMIPQAGGATYATTIKKGGFKMSEERYELTRARLTSAINLELVKFKDRYDMSARSFWGAVSYAFEHQEVDMKLLANKINSNPQEILSVARVAEQLRYFDQVYNKGVRAENKVFMSTDFQKRKYITK